MEGMYMLEEVKEFIEKLMSNKKMFADLSIRNYVAYDDANDKIKGGIAETENRGVLGYFQDEEGKRVAGINLKDKGTRIWLFDGSKYSRANVGWRETTEFTARQVYETSQERLEQQTNFIQKKWEEAKRMERTGKELSPKELEKSLKELQQGVTYMQEEQEKLEKMQRGFEKDEI